MSSLAINAFHRLQVRIGKAKRRPDGTKAERRLDGTAMFVLYHLCWRHMEPRDTACSSVDSIARELDRPRSVVNDALTRLIAVGLIRRQPGGGRGKANHYQLPFLKIHRLDPASKKPIAHNPKLSGPPDTLKLSGPPEPLSHETLRASPLNSPGQPSKLSGPPVHVKDKTIKRPPASAEGRAGRRPRNDIARRVFDSYLQCQVKDPDRLFKAKRHLWGIDRSQFETAWQQLLEGDFVQTEMT